MGDDMAIMAKAIERSAGLKAGTRTILLYRCAASALAVGLLAVPSIGHAQSGLELSKQQAEDAAGGARDFPLPDIRPEDFVTCNGEILLAGEECLAPTPTPTPASVSTNPRSEEHTS